MKKRINFYLICLMVTMLTCVTAAFGQDGSKINISGKQGTVKIGKGGITITGSDDSEVKTGDKDAKADIKPSPEGSSQVGEPNDSGTLVLTDDATISGKAINSENDGIILKGLGDYTLDGCTINAGKNAIVVTDQATVTIKNCVINGKAAAILVKGNSTTKTSNSVIRGKIEKLDNAEYIDKGGNSNL